MTTQYRHDVFKLILIVLAICDNITFMNCNNIRRNSRTGRRITREMKVDAILKDIRKGKNDIDYWGDFYRFDTFCQEYKVLSSVYFIFRYS